MQENQPPGDHISNTKKKQYVSTSESLSIKEIYGTALQIFGMFYVIYLSKFTEFLEMRNCE